ncbi:MAG: hypothetical protein ACJAWL_000545 [Motiliproteus sp.]|jgi:hypothetical protein
MVQQQGILKAWKDDQGFGFIEPGHGSVNKRPKRQPRSKPKKTGSSILSRVLTIIVIGVLGFVGYDSFQNRAGPDPSSSPGLSPSSDPGSDFSTAVEVNTGDAVIRQAFQNQRSNLQVSGSGVVVRTLPDDLDGSRHQRFILRLASGQTLLVAHNIDLAPRIGSLHRGDRISFNGEYEWNAEGGVLHWTHQDPRGLHKAGWLEHAGLKYQ